MLKFFRSIPILYPAAKKLKLTLSPLLLWIKVRARRRTDALKIVIGASNIYDQGWIPTEINQLNLLSLQDWERYFEENSIDGILAEHVWEHLTIEEGLVAARNCYRYLKSGSGYLRIAVPDGYHPNREYIDWVKIGGSGCGASDHKVLYNHDTLSELFRSAGFEIIFLEYFDSEGEFHAIDWNVEDGKIYRSQRFDQRNKDGNLVYTSLILDAVKR